MLWSDCVYPTLQLWARNISMRYRQVSREWPFDLDIVIADNYHGFLSDVGYSSTQTDWNIPPTAIMSLQM